jgi:ABC-type branched-subunit amino acid transport system permease subunit
MRMMLIYFVAAIAAYFLAGIKGRFTKRERLYFAIGAFVAVYLVTMILVFTGGNP